jgi:hypothetical protein
VLVSWCACARAGVCVCVWVCVLCVVGGVHSSVSCVPCVPCVEHNSKPTLDDSGRAFPSGKDNALESLVFFVFGFVLPFRARTIS